jgi:hypothetical protein
MVHFSNAAPDDEVSEEFLISGIMNFRDKLELDDVARGINTALDSVRNRGGRLNDDSAHVRVYTACSWHVHHMTVHMHVLSPGPFTNSPYLSLSFVCQTKACTSRHNFFVGHAHLTWTSHGLL